MCTGDRAADHTTMVPPSLSQTVYTQSQAHPPHTSTPSQRIKPAPSQSNSSSILAPNSCTQPSANSTQTKGAAADNKGQQEDTFKVMETPLKPTVTDQGQRSTKPSTEVKGQSAAKAGAKVKDESIDSAKVKDQGSCSKTTQKATSNRKITEFVRPTVPVSTRVTRPKPVSTTTTTVKNSLMKHTAIHYDDDDDDDEIVENSQSQNSKSDSQEDNSVGTSSRGLPGLSLKRNSQYSRTRYQSQDSLSTSPKPCLLRKDVVTPPSSPAVSDRLQKKGESDRIYSQQYYNE